MDLTLTVSAAANCFLFGLQLCEASPLRLLQRTPVSRKTFLSARYQNDRMIIGLRHTFLCMAMLLVALCNVESFVIPRQVCSTPMATSSSLPTTKLAMMPETTTSLTLAVDTVDPTNFLTDVFGSLLGTPAILAIPIVAALGVAGLVVFLIVSYANPAESDD